MLDYVTLGGARPSRFDGICGYASTSAVADGFVSSKLIEKVTYDNRPARANQVASCGDVILARMQSTSKVLEIDEENSGLIYSTGFAVLTPDSSMISQRCLFHLLLSAPFRRRKDQLCTGATQKAITNAGLKKLQVAFPAHKYQEQVVKELDNVLQQIEASRQRLNMLDSLAKSRFIEMFGGALSIENKWDSSILENCVESLESGKSPSCKNTSRKGSDPGVLKLSALSSGRFLSGENKAMLDGETIIQAKEVKQGDILLARKNTPQLVGSCVLVRENVKNLMFPDIVFRMHPNDSVNGEYLAALLSGPSYSNKVRGLAHGSNKSMSNIPKSELARLSIPLPPLSLQQQFAAFVASVDKSRFVVLNEKISRIQLISRRIAHRFSR